MVPGEVAAGEMLSGEGVGVGVGGVGSIGDSEGGGEEPEW